MYNQENTAANLAAPLSAHEATKLLIAKRAKANQYAKVEPGTIYYRALGAIYAVPDTDVNRAAIEAIGSRVLPLKEGGVVGNGEVAENAKGADGIEIKRGDRVEWIDNGKHEGVVTLIDYNRVVVDGKHSVDAIDLYHKGKCPFNSRNSINQGVAKGGLAKYHGKQYKVVSFVDNDHAVILKDPASGETVRAHAFEVVANSRNSVVSNALAWKRGVVVNGEVHERLVEFKKLIDSNIIKGAVLDGYVRIVQAVQKAGLERSPILGVAHGILSDYSLNDFYSKHKKDADAKLDALIGKFAANSVCNAKFKVGDRVYLDDALGPFNGIVVQPPTGKEDRYIIKGNGKIRYGRERDMKIYDQKIDEGIPKTKIEKDIVASLTPLYRQYEREGKPLVSSTAREIRSLLDKYDKMGYYAAWSGGRVIVSQNKQSNSSGAVATTNAVVNAALAWKKAVCNANWNGDEKREIGSWKHPNGGRSKIGSYTADITAPYLGKYLIAKKGDNQYDIYFEDVDPYKSGWLKHCSSLSEAKKIIGAW